MDTPLSFGDWVKQRRTVLGLTREQLAGQMSCAPVTIKKIEQDVRKPSQQMSELLATHLHIAEKERAAFLLAARGMGAPPALPVALPGVSTTAVQSAFAGNEALPVSAPAAAKAFVMRDAELAQLQTQLTQALAGKTQVIFVTGEAGSGKSSLLHEFARRAQQRHPQLVVAGGSCTAFLTVRRWGQTP